MKILGDRVAIVTGAGKSRGIGRASALALAGAGAAVVVTDLVRNDNERASLNAVVGELRTLGGEAHGMAVDVTRRADIEACVSDTIKRYGGVDILFNNAGTPVGAGAFLSLTDEQWDASYRVNVKGMADFCRAVIPAMQRRKSGSIINNASLAGLGAVPSLAPYIVSKFAVVGLTKAIACEFGVDNIRCNAICPGLVDTDMGRAEVEHFREAAQTFDEARTALASDVSLQKRWAEPAEVAAVVVFLAGQQSSYMTGVALPVAGGLPPGL